MRGSKRGPGWPQFERGNSVPVRHGAWSNRRVDPIVSELIAGVLERRPDLAEHPEALFAWGRAESRCLLLDEYLADIDFGSERAASVRRWVVSFERLAADMRARLGLDPRSEAALAGARADAERQVVDLDAIRSRGRRAIEARAR